MSINNKKSFFCFEILYNHLGQFYIKKRFFINTHFNFYRYLPKVKKI